jgi:hypothetical protein
MKKSVEDKINEIIKMAQASKSSSTPTKKLSGEGDSLSNAITNKKDADMFLAELELAIKMAHKQQ